MNGKLMEIKGKMLQMGIPTPIQLNMNLKEYQERLMKHGRADGVPLTTPLIPIKEIPAAKTAAKAAAKSVAKHETLEDKIKEMSAPATMTGATGSAKPQEIPVEVVSSDEEFDKVMEPMITKKEQESGLDG